MIFTNVLFLPFALFVLALLPLLGPRARVAFLIAASYVFYGLGRPAWVLLLLGCSMLDYGLVRLMHGRKTQAARRALMVVSVVVNISLLCFFKYAVFAIQTAGAVVALLGSPDTSLLTWSIELPLGISFFVFESLSYTVDVYLRRTEPARNFADFALFISFFPHLVAGPIVRAGNFLPQVSAMQPLRRDKVVWGMQTVLVGYFKKAVVADNCAAVADQVFTGYGMFGGAAYWIAALFFAVQIYCDFSGYTDIARGMARMIGIELCENFRWPYLSQGVRDFWRRWHISLSSWLRDYLYIPMGGSRHGARRALMATIATWFLGGLWHGAGWHFVAWGLYHGGLVAAGGRLAKTGAGRAWDRIPAVARIFFTFLLVVVGWVLFRADTLGTAARMIFAMFTPWRASFWRGLESVFQFGAYPPLFLLVLAGLHIMAYRRAQRQAPPILAAMPYIARLCCLGLLGFAGVLLAGRSQSFIYFQF